MSRTAAAISERELTAISRVGATATSGASVHDRAEEILGHLRDLIPIAGAMISYVKPGSTEASSIVVSSYSDRIAAHLNSPDYHTEIIQPFALPAAGWPVRERDLPVDPLSLRCVSEYFLPEGLVQGLNSALITQDGRYVGFVDISGCDRSHPTDAACRVIGHIAPVLANVVDPLSSARSLVWTLEDNAAAVGLIDDRIVTSLQGDPGEEFLNSYDLLQRVVGDVLRDRVRTAAFLWPHADGGWYSCRAFRCLDDVAVITLRHVGAPHDLTEREIDVLTRLIDGRSNSVIATELGIKTRTVRAHVQHILEKLRVPTRAAAVGLAIREGLLVPLSNGQGPSPLSTITSSSGATRPA